MSRNLLNRCSVRMVTQQCGQNAYSTRKCNIYAKFCNELDPWYICILSNYHLLFLPTMCPVTLSTLSLYAHLICILSPVALLLVHAPDIRCGSQKDSENHKMSDPQTLWSSFKTSSPSSFHLETCDKILQKCRCGNDSVTQQLIKFGHKSKINGSQTTRCI